ncbi:hypothetical protein PS870_05755 [Pseudomonas fluorescens]|uniref:RHS repeat-associated core domain-containing protein n=1 Tax=Pseudomonas fluorescens TaxID=294 RepID=A0A5E7Q8N7_PSEFL|nr:hypothetical protein PS870_05755 [Pseudomonas fluorescens]
MEDELEQRAADYLSSVLGFNGERIDPVLGGYHLGNGYRLYSHSLRRFTSPDSMSPFGQGGINPYAYCEGDPINNTDPTGHFGIFGAIINVGIFAADLFTDGAASATAMVLAREGESIAARKAAQTGSKAIRRGVLEEIRLSLDRDSTRDLPPRLVRHEPLRKPVSKKLPPRLDRNDPCREIVEPRQAKHEKSLRQPPRAIPKPISKRVTFGPDQERLFTRSDEEIDESISWGGKSRRTLEWYRSAEYNGEYLVDHDIDLEFLEDCNTILYFH